jgi:DNA-binding NarL/FixJ family response regulator
VSREPIDIDNGETLVNPSGRSRRPTILSFRELEVLKLVVSGLPMKSVARRLGITPRTVAFHKYRAMRALGLRDNAELIDYAIHHGLLRLKAFAPASAAHDGDLAAPIK